jgi:hypothetical protein
MREAVLLFAAMLACGRAASSEPSAAQRQGMPAWAVAALQAPEFAKVYQLSARLDPSLLHGDFDGDGQLDQAVLVSRRETGAQGIAFLHAGSARIVVVGAGHTLGNGGDDFSWMDAWSLLPSRSIPGGAGEPAPPALRGDALLVEKLESASAIVYWDGTAYRWHQQGD